MKSYISPFIKLYHFETTQVICASRITTSKKTTVSSNTSSLSQVYSSLTWNQKIAALNLMTVFGGSCSGSSQELQKINHIMTVEGRAMGVTGDQMRAGRNNFSGMKDMSNALIGADRKALENLFWAFYNIIAIGRNEQAAHILVAMYGDFGFSEDDCISILERRTGKRLSEL